jgi:hypothetical protein
MTRGKWREYLQQDQEQQPEQKQNFEQEWNGEVIKNACRRLMKTTKKYYLSDTWELPDIFMASMVCNRCLSICSISSKDGCSI